MNSRQRMSAFSILVQHEVKTWTATSFAILILVGFTNSIPVAPPEPAEPSSVSDASPESLHPGYYEYPYMEQEATDDVKGDPVLEQINPGDIDEENEISRYRETKRSPASRYWNLMKALEEELALEAMAKERQQPDGMDESLTDDVEQPNDVHTVNKRRRRYGFWVTAINKMDNGHLRGFLKHHKNIYNVYKRQEPNIRPGNLFNDKRFVKWVPRTLGRARERTRLG